MSTNEFRAAYWISADAQAAVVLTLEEDQHKTDAELLGLAKTCADEQGLDIGEGQIMIGNWTA